jgi:hypothetical protein
LFVWPGVGVTLLAYRSIDIHSERLWSWPRLPKGGH